MINVKHCFQCIDQRVNSLDKLNILNNLNKLNENTWNSFVLIFLISNDH